MPLRPVPRWRFFPARRSRMKWQHGLPTAVTLACAGGEAQWARLAPVIARPAFRPYYSADVIGASIGGAVKDVARRSPAGWSKGLVLAPMPALR